MEQKKTPLYILYYINWDEKKLEKDSTIYDTEIISGSDLTSSTQNSSITITVPKYSNAMSGEHFVPNSRWSTIMNNQSQGSKQYYVVSSSSYNDTNYLADPVYTGTFRPGESGSSNYNVTAYRPYFAGHLTLIDCDHSSDTISFTFSGFDWYYNKKLMDPDRTKLKTMSPSDTTLYAGAGVNYSSDSINVTLGTMDAPTRLPCMKVFKNDAGYNGTVAYRKGNDTTLQIWREGLTKITVSMNLNCTSDYGNTIYLNVYRSPNVNEHNTVDKVLIGSKTFSMEAGNSASQNFQYIRDDVDCVEIPSVDLMYDVNGHVYYDIWVECYSSGSSTEPVKMTMTSFNIFTYSASIDHDRIYMTKGWEPSSGYTVKSCVDSFFNSIPIRIMHSSWIADNEFGNTGYAGLYDPIVTYPDGLKRITNYIDNYTVQEYSFNKMTHTVYAAINSVLGNSELQPDWGTYLYSNGKICVDLLTCEELEHEVYTDYTNTDVMYNIKDNYFNTTYKYTTQSFPLQYGSFSANKTSSHMSIDGNVHYDPTVLMKGTQYQPDSPISKESDMGEINAMMAAELTEEMEQYIRNKNWFVYFPDGQQIPNVRVGDWFVSTPESPIQLRRQVTGISRVCEGGTIRWIYKMEGDE